MKKVIILLALLATSSNYARDCRELAFNANWPKDQIKRILSCDKIESERDYFNDDKLCLIIRQTQSSNFEQTAYNLLLVTNGYDYPLGLATVAVNNNGKPAYGNIKMKSNGDAELRGEFVVNNWDVLAKLNLKTPGELKLKVASKIALFGKTYHQATYRCDVSQ